MELGVLAGSREALNCTFTPLGAGADRSQRPSPSLGLTWSDTRGVIVWLVYAPTSLRAGELAGTYAGGTAEATIGVGLGANVLVGGSNQTVALQPVSVQGQVGVNLAVWFRRITTPLRALIDRSGNAVQTTGATSCSEKSPMNELWRVSSIYPFGVLGCNESDRS